jgi:endonuclease/exonuclease/phosphatase family metal-dependent hydrolase
MPAPAPTRLRIASYNLYKAKFLDRPGPRGGTLRDDFARLACLREADVLLLQEAIVGPLGRGGPLRDTVGELAADLAAGGEPVVTSFAGAPDRAGRRWGVGIVSRIPARFVSMWLPKPFWSPWQRAAMFAEIGAWVVGTLHLEVWPIGAPARRAQMRAVLATLDRTGLGAARPVVLAGDFNCERGGPHEELLRAGFVPASPDGGASFGFAGIRLRLDHIYVRGARVDSAGVAREARGSDHWPVWATVNCVAPASNVDIQTVHRL